MAALYGMAMPMMMRYEREILGQPERLPGLRSSLLCKYTTTQPSSAT